jgi:hypothetical protein
MVTLFSFSSSSNCWCPLFIPLEREEYKLLEWFQESMSAIFWRL